MIIRLIKAIVNVLVFFGLSIAAALLIDGAIQEMSEGSFAFFASGLSPVPESKISVFFSDLFVYFLYEKEVRIITLLILFILPHVSRMNGCAGTVVGGFMFKAKKAVWKIIGFQKPVWFWIWCVFSSFMPLIVPLVVWIVVRVLLAVLEIVLCPIFYVVDSVAIALKGMA